MAKRGLVGHPSDNSAKLLLESYTARRTTMPEVAESRTRYEELGEHEVGNW
jgi:hypothetical protein